MVETPSLATGELTTMKIEQLEVVDGGILHPSFPYHRAKNKKNVRGCQPRGATNSRTCNN